MAILFLKSVIFGNIWMFSIESLMACDSWVHYMVDKSIMSTFDQVHRIWTFNLINKLSNLLHTASDISYLPLSGLPNTQNSMHIMATWSKVLPSILNTSLCVTSWMQLIFWFMNIKCDSIWLCLTWPDLNHWKI